MTKTKKKTKGKAAKRRMTFEERKPKTSAWVESFDGTAYNGDIIKAYRKKFAVDRLTSCRELQLLGVEITPEQIAREQAAEDRHRQHLQNRKKKKREQKRMEITFQNPDQDDQFFFIAGYTSGGAPYGVTWDEMGLEPWEELE